ncbi:DUF2062 domain-containing protein [Acidicapsa acidisoli]|uniref:DUF2062 domain-containing protein n=1 Tax=Acidicapsa acidisoli TaxID=1615681 RepID=UPI0021E0CE8C|nr:DUF2062 domain-containing protein [Acidicapsa acidisoli]
MQRILQSGSPLSRRFEAAQEKILEWLQCGLAPRQLAFTLALGFAIGCIPLLGVTTAICALLAMMLRLNMPAIQAANWVAMPLQVVLLIPFLRLGHWLFRGESVAFNPAQLLLQIEAAPWHSLVQMSGLFGHAVVAWMITAGPALALFTILLTPLMHRISRLVPVAAD